MRCGHISDGGATVRAHLCASRIHTSLCPPDDLVITALTSCARPQLIYAAVRGGGGCCSGCSCCAGSGGCACRCYCAHGGGCAGDRCCAGGGGPRWQVLLHRRRLHVALLLHRRWLHHRSGHTRVCATASGCKALAACGGSSRSGSGEDARAHTQTAVHNVRCTSRRMFF